MVGSRYEIIEEALRNSIRSGGRGWFAAPCPFCEGRVGTPDRKRRFSFLSGVGVFHCFRCGIKGSLQGLPEGFTERDPASEGEVIARFTPPEGFSEIGPGTSGYRALSLEEPRAYLRSRGLPEDVWAKAQIGACAYGPYVGRVIVPVLGEGGEWLGFSARSWYPSSQIPYLYPRGMLKGKILYQTDKLFYPTNDPVFIVEGVFDALALPAAVAVLGKPTDHQLETIASAQRPVVFAFDGDAWQLSVALARKLRLLGKRAGYVRLPPGTDPDEVPLSWLQSEAELALQF